MNIVDKILRYFGYRHDTQLTASQTQIAKQYGHALNAMDANDAAKKLKCNHQKGGTVVTYRDGSIEFPSKGWSNQYAVIKHQHVMGDIWIECLRCGRKWKPPIRSDFKNERTYYKAFEEYEFMKDCPTNNTMSSSVQCNFRLNGSLDAGREYVRKQMANS